mmetsp:Transcript_63675/g.176584  ORF Transcript_63675/g.176584 Transcript_63675/m.176584 type:complete len:222 (+) Transcript_63675:620-1285(+)
MRPSGPRPSVTCVRSTPYSARNCSTSKRSLWKGTPRSRSTVLARAAAGTSGASPCSKASRKLRRDSAVWRTGSRLPVRVASQNLYHCSLASWPLRWISFTRQTRRSLSRSPVEALPAGLECAASFHSSMLERKSSMYRPWISCFCFSSSACSASAPLRNCTKASPVTRPSARRPRTTPASVTPYSARKRTTSRTPHWKGTPRSRSTGPPAPARTLGVSPRS